MIFFHFGVLAFLHFLYKCFHQNFPSNFFLPCLLTWFFIFNNEPYLSSQLSFAFSDNIMEIRIHFELYSVILTHFFEKISQFSFILMFAFVKIVTGDVRVTRSICRSKNLHFGFFKESSPNLGYIHLKMPNSFLECKALSK